MSRVTVIQRILYQYRVDFYRKLKDRLLKDGIKLQLIVEENQSQDAMDFLNLFNIKKSWHFRFLGEELICQPYLHLLNKSDLIILELGNKLLLNYILLLRRLGSSSKKIAFWGHAINMQVKSNCLRNNFKKTYFKNVDWWFPYTENMAKIIKNSGFPLEKITTIYNTTDTQKMIELKNTISDELIESLRNRLNVSTFPVGIFCGRMYKEKRMDFLLNACLKIKEKYSDFAMILIGDGEDSHKVKKAAEHNQWIKYVGPAYDKEKVAYFELADIFLSPGLVGLSITDSFALEVPMVTTDFPYHSSEIEYLKNGENGVITENNLDSYVSGILEILKRKEYLERLKEGCRQASRIYTMENMVNSLTDGIKKCLKS